jgi:hypothetical protein
MIFCMAGFCSSWTMSASISGSPVSDVDVVVLVLVGVVVVTGPTGLGGAGAGAELLAEGAGADIEPLAADAGADAEPLAAGLAAGTMVLALTTGAAAAPRIDAAAEADEIIAEAAVMGNAEGSDVTPLGRRCREETTCWRRTLQCIGQ